MPIKIFEIGPFALVSAVYKRNRDGKKSAVTIPARKEKPQPKTGAYCPECKQVGLSLELLAVTPGPNWLRDGTFLVALQCTNSDCRWQGHGNAMLWGVKEASEK